MITPPTRLTDASRRKYEKEVRDVVTAILIANKLPCTVAVSVTRGHRGVHASVKLLDPKGTTQQHWDVAQALKAEGIGSALLYHFTQPSRTGLCATTMSVMYYPMSPTDRHPMETT